MKYSKERFISAYLDHCFDELDTFVDMHYFCGLTPVERFLKNCCVNWNEI